MNQERKKIKAKSKNLMLAPSARTLWCLSVDIGTTLDDISTPEFWSDVAVDVKVGDRIEIVPDDFSFIAEVIVTDSTRHSLNVIIIYKALGQEAGENVEIKFPPPSEEDEFEVSWGGPHDKFRVIRKSDKVVVEKGFSTKELANQYIYNSKPKKV